MTFYSPNKTNIDLQYPFLITIGDNCNITEGVTILTHDYSWSVIKANKGELFGASGEVCIGDNCFIGRNSTILRGVTIGNNCVIGANSLVTKSIPSNEVWGGVPARKIMNIDEFSKKFESNQVSEAYNLYCKYYDRYHCKPKEKIFFEYIALFTNLSQKCNIEKYKSRMSLMGLEKTISYYKTHKPKYETYDDMLRDFQIKREEN